MKKLTVLALFALSLVLCLTAAAADGEPILIETPDQLAAMADDPAGFYALACDIDMAGVDWQPFAFSGVLDGQGHALLNLTVTKPGAEQAETYDGNMKIYTTDFAGLFSVLRGAELRNLSLVNVRALVEWDAPCFVGSFAGYMEDSTIRDCSVSGQLELRAHDRMFGVGGIAGFGRGLAENVVSDVTLICTDTDPDTRDEQFLGGAYGAGYIDLEDVEIRIDGYISDHGYVHSGGAVGMYMVPKGTKYAGFIRNCSITGKITFFEHNSDRRAYCRDLIGEVMSWTYSAAGNRTDFQRDERFDYSAELRPELCETPEYTETVIAPEGLAFGYTEYVCTGCGYTWRDRYTLHEHTAARWTLTRPATVETTGLSEAQCDICGKTLTREETRLDPPPVSEPESEPEAPPEPPVSSVPQQETAARKVSPWVLALPAVALLVCAGWMGIADRRKGKH